MTDRRFEGPRDRNNWTLAEVAACFKVPIRDLRPMAKDLGNPITDATIARYLDVRTEPGLDPWEMCAVYFVEAEGTNLIKIGRSKNFTNRLDGLRTMSPVPLKVLGVILYGSSALELHLHEVFAADRKHGEWFVGTRELRRFIEQRCSQYGPEEWPWPTTPYEDVYREELAELRSKTAPYWRQRPA